MGSLKGDCPTELSRGLPCCMRSSQGEYPAIWGTLKGITLQYGELLRGLPCKEVSVAFWK